MNARGEGEKTLMVAVVLYMSVVEISDRRITD